MNQSLVVNIMLNASQTQVGEAEFNNALKRMVKYAQNAGVAIQAALSVSFGGATGQALAQQIQGLNAVAQAAQRQAKASVEASRTQRAEAQAAAITATAVSQAQVAQSLTAMTALRAQTAIAVGSSQAQVAAAKQATAAINQQANQTRAANQVTVSSNNAQAASARAAAAASTAQAAASRANAAQSALAATQIRQQMQQTALAARQSRDDFAQIFGANFFANLATNIVESFTQGLRSLVTDSLQIAKETEAAFKGLNTVGVRFGLNEGEAERTVKDLDLVKAGLLNYVDAAKSLKNLLATGFNLDQSIEILKRFGDASAFSRQQSLSFGYAINSATEGIKNQNSLLVDNVGITKNLSVILAESGFQIQDLSSQVKGASARQALFNGLIREGSLQLGDAQKFLGTTQGQVQRISVAYDRLGIALGNVVLQSEGVATVLKGVVVVLDLLAKNTTVIIALGVALGLALLALVAFNLEALKSVPILSGVVAGLQLFRTSLQQVAVGAAITRSAVAGIFLGLGSLLSIFVAVSAVIQAFIVSNNDAAEAQKELTQTTQRQIDAIAAQNTLRNNQITALGELGTGTKTLAEQQKFLTTTYDSLDIVGKAAVGNIDAERQSTDDLTQSKQHLAIELQRIKNLTIEQAKGAALGITKDLVEQSAYAAYLDNELANINTKTQQLRTQQAELDELLRATANSPGGDITYLLKRQGELDAELNKTATSYGSLAAARDQAVESARKDGAQLNVLLPILQRTGEEQLDLTIKTFDLRTSLDYAGKTTEQYGKLQLGLANQVNNTTAALDAQIVALLNLQGAALASSRKNAIDETFSDIAERAKGDKQQAQKLLDEYKTKVITDPITKRTTTFGEQLKDAQNYREVLKDIQDREFPSLAKKRQKQTRVVSEESELKRLTDAYKKLEIQVRSFSDLSSPAFQLRFKKEDLERTVKDFEQILTLRRELNLPLDTPLPTSNRDLDRTIETLERLKKVRDEIRQATDAVLEAETRLIILQETALIPVVNAETRANIAYYESLKNRREAEQQLTADLVTEYRKRSQVQGQILQVQAEVLRDSLKHQNQQFSDAQRALAAFQLAQGDRFATNPLVKAALEIAAKPLPSPVLEKLDTSNKLLGDILRVIQATLAERGITHDGTLRVTSGSARFDAAYLKYGQQYGIDPNLLLEQGRQESVNFKPSVIFAGRENYAGAGGIAQFLKDTAKRFGLTAQDRFNPEKAIEAQAKYMRFLLDMFNNDVPLALAGYNAGEGRAQKALTGFKETRNYVATITGKLQQAGVNIATAGLGGGTLVLGGATNTFNANNYKPGTIIEGPVNQAGVTVTTTDVGQAQSDALIFGQTLLQTARFIADFRKVTGVFPSDKTSPELLEGYRKFTVEKQKTLEESRQAVVDTAIQARNLGDVNTPGTLVGDAYRAQQDAFKLYRDVTGPRDAKLAAARLDDLYNPKNQAPSTQVGDSSSPTEPISDKAIEIQNALTEAAIKRTNAEADALVRIAVAEQELMDLRNGDVKAAQNTLIEEIDRRKAAELNTLRQLTAYQQLYDTGYFESADYRKTIDEENALQRLQTHEANTREIIGLENQIAHAGEDSAQRRKVAYLKAVREIQEAEENAADAIIRARVQLDNQNVFSATQANAKVLEFLASQKSVTDIVADAQIGVIRSVYDTLDAGLGRLTKRLGIVGNLVKDLISGFIKLSLNREFQRFFDPAGVATNGSNANRGGGFGGFLNTLFGGGGNRSSGGFTLGPGGTAGFNPNAGLSGGVFSIGSNYGAVTGLTSGALPAFVRNAQGLFVTNSDLPIATTLPGPQGVLVGTSATGGIAPQAAGALGSASSLGALFKGFGFGKTPGTGGALSLIAPLIGAQLGSGLGGSSGLGRILGGVGGAAVGIGAFAAPAFLTTGIFGAGGALAGVGSALVPLFSNPITAAVGGALLIGAILLGRNSARRQAEKQSTAIRTDAKGKLQDILNQVRRGQLPTATAMQQANAIRASYLDEVGKIKDRKTRNIGLALVRELDAIIAQITSEGARQDQARELDKIIVPTFATGGGGTAFRRYNGLVGDRGYGAGDVIPAFIDRTETVINAAQRERLGGAEAMRRAGVPGYGTQPAPSVQPPPSLSTGGGNFTDAPSNNVTFMAVIVADDETADELVARARPGTVAKKVVLARRDDPSLTSKLFN